jgi:TRAP-type uncharacterized transport system substrate-binding protein
MSFTMQEQNKIIKEQKDKIHNARETLRKEGEHVRVHDKVARIVGEENVPEPLVEKMLTALWKQGDVKQTIKESKEEIAQAKQAKKDLHDKIPKYDQEAKTWKKRE